MAPNRRLFLFLALSVLPLAGLAGPVKRALIDPFPLRFPLAVAGALEIEGRVVGQPRVQNGIVYFASRDGYLTAVVIPSRTVLWRFKAEGSLSTSPEVHGDVVLFRDDKGVPYGVVSPGRDLLAKKPAAIVATPIHIIEGGVYCGTADGRVLVSDLAGDGSSVHSLPAPDSGITAGPVAVWNRAGWLTAMLFGRLDGLLVALAKGKPVWLFKAGGAISADPIQAGGRLFFGDAGRQFYCLDAATGQLEWKRTLQGAPVHPAVVAGGAVAVAASNSVVYRLSAKGGSILSWEAVPSRIVYEPAAAGPLVLVSSASPTLTAIDLLTGKRAGQYEAPGVLAAGAVWSSPYVVLFVEDPESGRQRIIFLRSR